MTYSINTAVRGNSAGAIAGRAARFVRRSNQGKVAAGRMTQAKLRRLVRLVEARAKADPIQFAHWHGVVRPGVEARITVFPHVEASTGKPWFYFKNKGDWGTMPRLTALVTDFRQALHEQGRGYPWTAKGDESEGWCLTNCYGEALHKTA